MTRIVSKNQAAITAAIDVWQKGGLVIFPCETVYGVAVDAHNTKAVQKLSLFKKRPLGKPYAIMVTDQKMAERYVRLNQTAQNLYQEFLPGPVTVISQAKHQTAPGVESEMGTLGVRIPDYPFMQKLISKFGRAIVASSANASYQKRPYKIADVLENISTKQKSLIDLIIDAGELPHHEPSTVIDTTLDDPAVLRQGEIQFQNQNEIFSRSEENTRNFGKELWQKYEGYVGKRPLIFALEGEMGTGKTQLTKGLSKAMGITEEVISPTFNLVLNYQSPGTHVQLYHLDAWRLQNSEELKDLGFIKMLEEKNLVVVIEWAEKVADLIKKYRDQSTLIWVKIKYGKGENERYLSWGAI